MKPFTFKGWPPENSIKKSPLQKKLEKYDKKHGAYISPEDFKSLFPELLQDSDFFQEIGRVSAILNESIDEIGFAEDNEEMSDTDLQEQKVIKINSYFNQIYGSYQNGTFGEKIRSLKLMASTANSAPLANNSTLSNELIAFAKTALEKEKTQSGNYFIFLQLQAMLSEGDSLADGTIAPEQFVYKENGKCFVSSTKDFDDIVKIKQEIVQQKEKTSNLYEELNKKFTINKSDGTSSTTIDLRSEDPLTKEYVREIEALSQLSKQLKEYFKDELAPQYFINKAPSDKEQNGYIDHQFFLNKSIRNDFEKRAGFPISDASVPEQYNFFEYTKEFTNKEIEKVFQFLKNYELNGFRTFLSLEKGGKVMGDKILALGLDNKIPKESAEKLFKKYGEIVDTSLKAQETLESLLPKEVFEASTARLAEIKDSLLKRAKDLLVKYSDLEKIDEAQILKELDRYKEEIVLFAETYKSVVKSGQKINLEDVPQTQIKVLSIEEREKNADKLWDINKENRKKFITNPDDMNKRELRFRQTLKDPNVSFYDIEYKDNIAGFCSLAPQPDASLLLESLNAFDEIKGTKVAGDFFKTLAKQMNKDHAIFGYVHGDNAGSLPYYENMGFAVTNEIKEGKPVFKISLPKQSLVG